MLIAACGNVVNDIFDEENDALNHKTKVGYQKQKAINWFFLLFVCTLIVAFYVANEINQTKLSSISIIAIALLVIYSKTLQKLPLIGNFLISVFVAFVPGIIWFAEKDSYNQLAESSTHIYERLTILLGAYMVFGFIANMFREIIKDIEDVKGDSLANYKTIAVSWGVQKSKVVALFYGIFLLILELLWAIFNPLGQPIFELLLFFILVIIPCIIAISYAYKARSILDFRKTSKAIKIIMALGLIYLVIIQTYVLLESFFYLSIN